MKVLTVGGATLDSIAIIESDRIERVMLRNSEASFLMLEEGRKTEAQAISTHCGGGAVNAAVAMSRLGLDAAALVKLGQDQRAETILTGLASEGVSARWAVRSPHAPTGASVFISSHDRNAAIFTFRGANTLLESADLRKEAFEVDMVYVSSLSNESANCFPEIVSLARANRAFLATNPGIRQLSARSAPVIEALGDIDALFINRHEADALVPALVARFGEGGCSLALDKDEQPPTIVARGFCGGGFEMTAHRFLTALLELGVPNVVVTDGAAGAIAASGNRIVFCPALSGPVAGTAGAGDAFSATCAAYLARGAGLDEALRAGAVNAAGVIAYADTQTGLLAADALEARLGQAADRLPLREWEIGGAEAARQPALQPGESG